MFHGADATFNIVIRTMLAVVQPQVLVSIPRRKNLTLVP